MVLSLGFRAYRLGESKRRGKIGKAENPGQPWDTIHSLHVPTWNAGQHCGNFSFIQPLRPPAARNALLLSQIIHKWYYINMASLFLDSSPPDKTSPGPGQISPPAYRRTLLILLAFCLAASLLPFAALPAVESVLFRPEPLLSALETAGFYQQYPRLMTAFSAAGGDLIVPGLGGWVTRNLTASGLENALKFLFPEDWVRAETGRLTVDFYAYLNFEAPNLDLSLNLGPVRDRLTGGEGRNLVKQALDGWEPCTLETGLLAGALLLQGRTAELPHCRPPDSLMPAYLQILQAGFDALASGLPERISLLPPQPLPPSGPYAVLRWGLRLSPLLPVMLLLLAFLVLRSPRALLAWSGVPFYTGGLSGVLSAGLLGIGAAWILALPAPVLPLPVAELYIFAAGVFLAVWRQFLLNWVMIAALFASLGLFAIFASAALDRYTKESS